MAEIQERFSYKDLGNGIYDISSPPMGGHQYLVVGEEKALLVDSGMGLGSIKDFASTITKLPIILINTHGHPDHAGGNYEFEPALINPDDLDVYEKMATYEYRIQDVGRVTKGKDLEYLQPTGPTPKFAYDGQIIELGNRNLEIIFTPGHTHGSLCVYDELTGTMFTGDNVQSNATTLIEWNSSTVEDLYDSLIKLSKYSITRILTGHKQNDNPPSLLNDKIICAKEILDGAIGVEKVHMGIVGLCHEYNGTSIMYTENNIHK